MCWSCTYPLVPGARRRAGYTSLAMKPALEEGTHFVSFPLGLWGSLALVYGSFPLRERSRVGPGRSGYTLVPGAVALHSPQWGPCKGRLTA